MIIVGIADAVSAEADEGDIVAHHETLNLADELGETMKGGQFRTIALGALLLPLEGILKQRSASLLLSCEEAVDTLDFGEHDAQPLVQSRVL